jgi:hypothetical protein
MFRKVGKEKHLWEQPITMFIRDLMKCLVDANIGAVEIKQFAMKGDLESARRLLKSLREADPDCTVEFDLATNISPQIFHWPNDDNMVFATAELRESIYWSYITLCQFNDIHELNAKHNLVEGCIINHYPMLGIAQFDAFQRK